MLQQKNNTCINSFIQNKKCDKKNNIYINSFIQNKKCDKKNDTNNMYMH